MFKPNFKFFILILTFLTNSIYAQTFMMNWDKTFGGNERDWNTNIVKTNSGKLFIIGDSQTDVDGNKNVPLCNATGTEHADIWLMRLDTSGTILWQKDLGAENDERLPFLFPLNDIQDRMILSCYSFSDIACDKTEPNRDTVPLLSADYWISMLDSNGMIIWDKTLGGDNFDDYPRVVGLSNGEILISGESNSGINGDKTVPNYGISNDLWSIKTDGVGNIVWDKVYGGTDAEYIAAIIPGSNGEFTLCGSTQSDIGGDISEPTQGGLDYWMIHVDNNGNKIWDKRFGGSLGEKCLHAIKTYDNGYLLCGYTTSPAGGDVSEAPKGLQDFWIVKTDSIGNKMWDKRFGGTNGSFATGIEQAPSNAYWIYGYTSSTDVLDVTEPSYGGSDYWIIKIDSLGSKLWDKRFGGDANEISGSLVMMADSSVMLFGYSDSGYSAVKTGPSYGGWDFWLVKFKYSDFSSGLTPGSSLFDQLRLYPNPVINQNHINLSFFSIQSTELYLFLRDPAGKEVFQSQNSVTPGSNTLSIPLKKLASGIYTLELKTAENQHYRSKLLILE
jgi:hypothetical protein